ncbi:hypothetical protein SNEBB_009259 [Seison nebaliae]|nr:hypothetical protein SNEBB_009259 [Seison nebaliae]
MKFIVLLLLIGLCGSILCDCPCGKKDKDCSCKDKKPSDECKDKKDCANIKKDENFPCDKDCPCKDKKCSCKDKECPCKDNECPCKDKKCPCKDKKCPCKDKECPCKDKECPCKDKECPFKQQLTCSNCQKAFVQKSAPDFKATAVIGNEFKDIQLSDYFGKYIVLFFYPLDFTFVCPTEIIAFNDHVEEFEKINTQLLAVSVDSHFSHLTWTSVPRSKGGLGPMKIPLISDLTHQISKNYGVYLEEAGHSLRGLFIIDPKGIIRQITINDLPVGRSVDETKRLVQAFQFTDENGEVCPIDWNPGKDTIIPSPELKLKYFEKHGQKKEL